MNIAIVSDSHDNITNIKKFLDFCHREKIKKIVHCGDVTEETTYNFFRENFAGEIFFVEGNADISEQKKTKKTNRFQKFPRHKIPFLEIVFDDLKIAVCHQKSKALSLAKKNIYHLIFYGHSHRPWQEKINKTFLINPGNLAGMFYRATFATFNTSSKKLKLILLETL